MGFGEGVGGFLVEFTEETRSGNHSYKGQENLPRKTRYIVSSFMSYQHQKKIKKDKEVTETERV